jgi:hypothetical protein
MSEPCRQCGAQAKARGLCAACYEYRRANGKDRPEQLILRAGNRIDNRRYDRNA